VPIPGVEDGEVLITLQLRLELALI
jgi:hypothetical protein